MMTILSAYPSICSKIIQLIECCKKQVDACITVHCPGQTLPLFLAAAKVLREVFRPWDVHCKCHKAHYSCEYVGFIRCSTVLPNSRTCILWWKIRHFILYLQLKHFASIRCSVSLQEPDFEKYFSPLNFAT